VALESSQTKGKVRYRIKKVDVCMDGLVFNLTPEKPSCRRIICCMSELLLDGVNALALKTAFRKLVIAIGCLAQ